MVLVTLAVLLLNIPFGYWREGVRKFSVLWFVFIHAPIPVVVVLRHVSGIGFSLHSYPILLSAFFLGQFLGSRYRRRRLATAT